MEGYGTQVELIAFTLPTQEFFTRDSQTILEYASRLCVDREDDTGTRKGYIRDRIAQGHESVIEHASASFLIVCSRVVTHELVRHRIASYSQRSQRYVREDGMQYLLPPELIKARENVAPTAAYPDSIFVHHMEECWRVYRKLLEVGLKPEIARYVLPNACQTKIVATMNFRELRHFIRLRTSPKALPEMQEVAGKVRDICKELAPEVFEDV